MEKLVVPTMAEMMAKGERPDVLFWVVQVVSMTVQKK